MLTFAHINDATAVKFKRTPVRFLLRILGMAVLLSDSSASAACVDYTVNMYDVSTVRCILPCDLSCVQSSNFYASHSVGWRWVEWYYSLF